jgi:tetratricopeptide (TPR) repeat protein
VVAVALPSRADAPPARPSSSAAALAVSAAPAAAPGSAEALRLQVSQVPGDPDAWTALGLAELEQGRVTGDPARYAAAGQAFDTSLRLRPDGAAALAGQAALADARHDFSAGLALADRALAASPAQPEALAARVDALTELGRYPQAKAAALALDQARPGVASFARLSYQAELRGDLPEALRLIRSAAADAGTPEQAAFARLHEGLLALGSGDRAGAAAALRAGVAVAPDDPGLLLLAARLDWASGRREQAAMRYATLVARRPTASAAYAQAEALAALGRPAEAGRALALARAASRLAGAAGVAPEGIDVLAEADHGDPARAVRMAADLWSRSRATGAADAYAWALHAAGRDAEALPLAQQALALGGRPALWLYHRGVIRAALGDQAGAVADLREALRTDPAFSPLHAPRAGVLLRTLGGAR